ncbi:MAG: SOS response-associated peptidase [Alphaproteobacteria bacterium]|nr:MAG: SOS response-associated peptidase [Alphaproteobacteria bacterium]
MCGRYTLTSPAEVLRNLFGFPERPNLQACYNIAPTTSIAAVRKTAADGERHFFSAHWGLIPPFAKSADIGVKMINARSETVTEKPSFRAAFKSRRCLIPANGFYEWEKKGPKEKQPWLIGLNEAPLFAFAGLWEEWQGPQGEQVRSCTILTTTAAESIRFIHPRMPVILDPENYDDWLNGSSGTDLLRPASPERLCYYPVANRVGNVRNDDAGLLEPLEKEEPDQKSLF